MADKTEGTAVAVERAVPRFEVKLLKPHTHERVDLESGATIKVTAEQRAWLKSLGVIAGDMQEK
ncbi:hypothetical protein [Pseudomonas baltica]|uniref:DUF7210 family protein n=1 Tax=Pseudomonas baltica TaxID=2762576 RepID=UPI0028A22D50|nr:hypothetical protein [Pseudomonas baltica]